MAKHIKSRNSIDLIVTEAKEAYSHANYLEHGQLCITENDEVVIVINNDRLIKDNQIFLRLSDGFRMGDYAAARLLKDSETVTIRNGKE